MPKCKTCIYSQFKMSATRNWIECLNPDVLQSIRLSFRHVEEIYQCPSPQELKTAIRDYLRVQFDEDAFGCRFHQQDLTYDEEIYFNQ